MKTFENQNEYIEWVEQVRENYEQVGSRVDAAHIAISALDETPDGLVTLVNGMPLVKDRAPPSEIIKHTLQDSPYEEPADAFPTWRTLAVYLLARDIECVRQV